MPGPPRPIEVGFGYSPVRLQLPVLKLPTLRSDVHRPRKSDRGSQKLEIRLVVTPNINASRKVMKEETKAGSQFVECPRGTGDSPEFRQNNFSHKFRALSASNIRPLRIELVLTVLADQGQ